MCNKQFWEQHAPFLAIQKIIIIISTITLLQLMGIIPTKATFRKCKDSVGGKVQIKCKQPYAAGAVTVMLVNSFSERKTTFRPL